jgi:quercetin dioxygenase-like cupin family protein
VGYSVLNVEDIEGAGPGGAIRFAPGTEGYEHDETRSGQEEVSVVVSGSGIWRIDGEEVPVRAGSFIRFDPESTRCPVAGPDGLTFLSVGARPGAYEPRGPF